MTIYEKIKEITLDEKQAYQVFVMFNLGFQAGMVYQRNVGVGPDLPDYEELKEGYLNLIETDLAKEFEKAMKEYEKEGRRDN